MFALVPILIAALSASTNPGPARIIGRVVDHKSGEAVVGATVRIGGVVQTTDQGLTIEDWDFLAPLTIEAIEVYTKTTPQEYSHPCGTVLICTRRGH